MELRQLRYFLAVAETLHFGRAAELEHIAQSVVSVQISRLEQELGVTLFHRTSRHVEITPAGAAFRTHAQLVLSELGEGIAAARGCLVENQHLRIGAFTDDPLTHRFLSTFQRRHPKARLSYTELSISTQISGVVDGHVDVSLVWLPSADRRVRVDPLYMEMPVAAVPASHPLARKRRLGIDDLLDEPFALAAEGTPSEWRAHWSLDSRRGGPPKGDVEVTSARESIAAVAYSGAVDTMSANSAGFWSHPGVRFLPIEDAEPTSLALVTASHSSRPLVESFRDIVMEIVRDEIAAAPGAVSLVS